MKINYKLKYTEDDEHLCMEDTKRETEKFSWNYLTMQSYLILEDDSIQEYFTIEEKNEN